MWRRLQFRWASLPTAVHLLVFLEAFAALGWMSKVLLRTDQSDLGYDNVLVTAICSVAAWALPSAYLLAVRRTGRGVTLPHVKLFRCGSTAAFAGLLLHVAFAFHVAQGWSRGAAYENVTRVGGFGEGAYVSGLFVTAWAGELLWVWLAPGSYRTRPAWVIWVVHGFMWFAVFNATVVYGGWVMRVCAGVAVLELGLMLMWQEKRTRGRSG